MYLKSIEVQGFKSFANRLVLEFHNGITGIVGPNGSGKSNVADAVRWVLGEQRIRQLRGSSLQDVIFAGTESRRPQGFAYVAITLDNSDHQLAVDYDQVTVARRVYRSGESEYLLNGSACRLRDINELFYDTGIGKEGYSIIGQGQIDKILSDRPEDRRELFDEAAGIVKFKRRKAVARRQLEDEQLNRQRVEDVLAEMERQAGPLEKQAETAREYLRLRDGLRTQEANLFLRESGELKERIREAREKETAVCADLRETQELSDRLRDDYGQLDAEIGELDRQTEEKRGQRNREMLRKGNLEGQIQVLREQIRAEEQAREQLRQRLEEIQKDEEDRREQIARCEAEEADLLGQLADGRKRQEEAEAQLGLRDEAVRRLEEQAEQARARLIGGLNEKAALTARRQHCETMLEQVRVRRSETAGRLLRSESDGTSRREQAAEAGRELEQAESRIAEIEGKLAAREKEIAACEEEERRLSRAVGDSRQEYQTVRARLDTLRNLTERYEGYGGAIRRVMELRDRVPGIRGVVADLITAGKEYETAIETALGGSIQNIVTDSEATAKQLIGYLKRNRYGRATFLPLDGVEGRGGFSPESALREPGVLGLASRLAEVEPAYRGLCEYLLGRVVVTDDLDHAVALAGKYRHTLRIVTLEGELLSPGGSMTGGAFRGSGSLLGRRREIGELESACRTILARTGELREEAERAGGLLQEKRREREEIRGELQRAGLERNTLQVRLDQLRDRIRETAGSCRDLEEENRQLEEQIGRLEEERAALEEETRRLEERSRQEEQESGRAGRELEEARSGRQQTADELSGVRVDAARLRQRQESVAENGNRLRDELRLLEEERERLLSGSRGSESAAGEKESAIGGIRGQIRDACARMDALDEEIGTLVRRKEERSGRRKSLFEEREKLSGRLGLLDREQVRLQGQREKLEDRLEGQTDYMWSEYGLTSETAESFRDPELTSVPQMRKTAEQLKDGIRALGSVNVNAIEDYRKLSERYEFEKAQHEDLVRSESAILQIMEELDTGMRRQFAEKFRDIRREFDKVFRELFGGGYGTLELVEDEDILEAGVQIIAQPPGKKLQNVMQLSGGEKALTAISLLFAIQNLKPSPFCLLDEIEAALDDSNVGRFAGYLRKLATNTQFIVITHRRGTMVSADRLYGITMQEKGISTLVSVDLIEESLDR